MKWTAGEDGKWHPTLPEALEGVPEDKREDAIRQWLADGLHNAGVIEEGEVELWAKPPEEGAA